MKILLLGGTGAMGLPLMHCLAKDGHEVIITSRSERSDDRDNVTYIQGNAKDNDFLDNILADRYDAIVDFMHYRTHDFQSRIDRLLNATNHYFFLSSSRVYAPLDSPITENSPRLLDVVRDEKYLATEEYALSKARCEDLLFQSNFQNWTIIRPYITYNTERLQLGLFEKEGWLYRALQGKSIVFSKDIAERKTCLTHGDDVAKVIAYLIEQEEGKGEAVNVVGRDSMTWGNVLKIYLDVIEETMHFRPNVIMLEHGENLGKVVGNFYKLKYDRMVDKYFDNTKVDRICQQQIQYMGMKEGLSLALRELLEKIAKEEKNIERPGLLLEAYLDKCVGEREKLKNYSAMEKIKYLTYRYTPYINLKIKFRKDVWW